MAKHYFSVYFVSEDRAADQGKVVMVQMFITAERKNSAFCGDFSVQISNFATFHSIKIQQEAKLPLG